jgi:hypothetical protein
VHLGAARDAAIALLTRDLAPIGLTGALDLASPDGDPGKFSFLGDPVRVIVERDGYYLNINPGWFGGLDEPPRIKGGAFCWYVFVLEPRRGHLRYHLCSWRQMRRWAMDFAAPLGRDFKDELRWRADLHPIPGTNAALFRWGDETRAGLLGKANRICDLDNVALLLDAERPAASSRRAPGGCGESEAHRLLKLYVARHPELVGASMLARAELEHRFATGDRVDVILYNHAPECSVIEVEVEGEEEVVVGVFQALKYQTLASSEAGYPLTSDRASACVVAYQTHYSRAQELAERYDVRLISVDQAEVIHMAAVADPGERAR